MGQKVHPIGFRVGITKKYQSQWFARFHKYNYAQSILEDHMLRTTLLKIFPDLLNPAGLSKKKQDSTNSDRENNVTSKITQIKIERSLIPYEIGIQIYSENAELIKTSIDNLKINTDLFCYLQKTRQYLMKLKQQINSPLPIPSGPGEGIRLASPILASVLATREPNPCFATEGKGTEEKQVEGKALVAVRGNSLDIDRGPFDSSATPTLPSFAKEQRSSQFAATEERVGVLLPHKNSFKEKRVKEIRGRFLYTSTDLKKAYKPKLKKIINKVTGFRNIKFFGSKDKNSFNKKSSSFGLNRGPVKGAAYVPYAAKAQYKKKRLVQRRLKKRRLIVSRYAQVISKGLAIKKTDNSVLRQILLKTRKQGDFRLVNNSNGSLLSFEEPLWGKGMNRTQKREGFVSPVERISSLKSRSKNSYSGIKKKFLTLFIKKTNKNFLKHLKEIMSYWHNYNFSALTFAPFGYSQHWTNARLKLLKKQPIHKLTNLIQLLEQKSLKKMEQLRNHYLAFGMLSKTQGLGYYQIITFLKSLKKSVFLLQNKPGSASYEVTSLAAPNFSCYAPSGYGLMPSKTGSRRSKVLLAFPRSSEFEAKVGRPAEGEKGPKEGTNIKKLSGIDKLRGVSDKVLITTLNNVETQCRKIKFLSYLKKIVKKHREQNIFFYLRNMSDARKNLKNLKSFTKTHAKFLFGLDLNKKSNLGLMGANLPGASVFGEEALRRMPTGGKELPSLAKDGTQSLPIPYFAPQEKVGKVGEKGDQEKLKERVKRVLTQNNLNIVGQSTSSLEFEKTLQKSFLYQIEKQKNMNTQNLNLIPKISIKFYSIKVVKNLECKASLVADSIIDALEKRKAFRKVIKDAKENLMRISKVKGVKIQVAGRLNGAEIARTEWVRAGRVPLQTLRANIDYCSSPANTIYGIIGVKVWIFKGYSKML